jgi:thiol-disulfide isomerase/thioredoxin
LTRQRRHLLAQPGPDTGDAGAGPALTLVVRSWCSLCDTMREALAPVAARHGARVAEVDLDAHPDWEERFGERVPLLLAGAAPEGAPLAALTLDANALDAWLTAQAVARDRDFR